MEFPRNYDDMDTPHLFVKALSLVIFIYVIFINLRRSIYNPQPKKWIETLKIAIKMGTILKQGMSIIPD